jgi:albonoursin synthase
MLNVADDETPLTRLDTLRLIQTRSVVRSYTSAPVSDGAVEQMVSAMLAAPSASNKQAWGFVIVRNPVNVRRIRAFSPGIAGIPALIVVACFDHARFADCPRMNPLGRLCVAMAVENLLLATHTLGLGACPISSFQPGPIRRLLNLPDHLEPLLVVPVGHPERPPQASHRRNKEEVISYESWGNKSPIPESSQ